MSNLQISEFGCPLPRAAVFHWARAPDWDNQATAEEEFFIRQAVLKRQREFRAGRNAARRCFQTLADAGQFGRHHDHLAQLSVGVGDSREPIWPTSVTGSISHTQFECYDSHSTQEYCAAVVASRANIRAIGIDIERVGDINADALPLIVTDNERQRSKQQKWPKFWPKYIFTAKESFYKCFFPLAELYIDFLQADFCLHAIQSLPGTYRVEVANINIDHPLFTQTALAHVKGFVSGGTSLIKSAFWLASDANSVPQGAA